MASIFGHGVVAYTFSKILDRHNSKWLLVAAIISSILPDIDVMTFHLGVPYEAPFGHRGFTHSILFAILWAFLLMVTFGKKHNGLWFVVILLSTLSHGILDAMTTGGRGVGFLIPFNNDRVFFPLRKIMVSPIEIKSFFSDWGLQVIFSEIKYILLPCILILTFLKINEHSKRTKNSRQLD
ncbi:metal-dependent hydrolase [uncultured Algibacter sp.]|uniref:metal-dependent hydrolase n=1 Tax=uncultured Algibacter sp. TaxID=298659 RepID=UPI002618C787|nr:metal-dependent hydrolase [uncultured Algibacter sp.]